MTAEWKPPVLHNEHAADVVGVAVCILVSLFVLATWMLP